MVFCLGAVAPAPAGEEELRSSLNDADHSLLDESAYRYRSCVGERAAAVLPDHDDVPSALGVGVEGCAPIIDKLVKELGAANLHPGLASGLARRIKSNTIRELLPALISAKAQQSAP